MKLILLVAITIAFIKAEALNYEQNIYVAYVNEAVNMTCFLSYESVSSISWYDHTNNNNGKLMSTFNGYINLVINNVQKNHAGTYRCSNNNFSKFMELIVINYGPRCFYESQKPTCEIEYWGNFESHVEFDSIQCSLTFYNRNYKGTYLHQESLIPTTFFKSCYFNDYIKIESKNCEFTKKYEIKELQLIINNTASFCRFLKLTLLLTVIAILEENAENILHFAFAHNGVF